jgi:hypothetical protein
MQSLTDHTDQVFLVAILTFFQTSAGVSDSSSDTCVASVLSETK